GFLSVVHFKASDFCGDHLLTWALDPQCWSHFPISTRTVQALTKVEALSLAAEDLKSAASQFRRLHIKQLQHTFQCNGEHGERLLYKQRGGDTVVENWQNHYRKKKTVYETRSNGQTRYSSSGFVIIVEPWSRVSFRLKRSTQREAQPCGSSSSSAHSCFATSETNGAFTSP
ncbi:unnamed protein product, partial [Brassica rapa subsp. narinosa]